MEEAALRAEVDRLRARVRELEGAVVANEATYRAMFEHNRAVKLLIDPLSGAIVDANQAAVEFYAWTKRELTSMNIAEINTLTRSEVEREMAEAQASRRLVFRFRHRRGTGDVRDVEVFSGPTPMEGRTLLHSIVVDVTERVAAERELRRAERGLRDLIDRLRAPIVVVQRGVLAFANHTTAELLGASSPRELIGRPAVDLLVPEQRAEAALAIASMEHGGPGLSGREWRFLTATGRQIWTEVKASLHEFDGAPAVLVVVHDLTQRKRLEQDLRTSQRLDAMGRVAGAVAHDFNNLLLVILNIAGLVRRPGLAAERVPELAGEIEDSALRAADLTRKLLMFAGQPTEEPQLVEVGSTAQSLERLLRGALADRIELVLTTSASGIVRLPRLGLEQILLNLVVNARDALPEGGTIRVDVSSGGPGRVQLSVRDDGVGMAPETRAQAFDPFFTTKAPDRGTGLGLSIVYGIVMDAGGRVEIESELGQGTHVRITLPIAEGARATTPPASATRVVRARRASVLVVDDDEQVRRVVSRMLETNGYDPQPVESGAGALARLALGPEVDLVLSDVMMPRMTGIELASAIVRRFPRVPVLLMTGFLGSDQERDASDLGVRLLHKPFAEGALVEAVEAVLAQPPRASSDGG